MATTLPAPQDHPRVASPPRKLPAFSSEDVTVIFVLGGPGSGKGTQCGYLVKDYGFVHLSAGDLLRAEQDRPGSEFGELIHRCIREGVIVPMEVTIALLENAVREAMTESSPSGDTNEDKDPERKLTGRFLIDGFPRKMDQAIEFERTVCESRFTIFFDCPIETMLERLLNRAKTSGRADDNPDSIKKRFRTFEETSMPVVDYFRKQTKVVTVDASPDPDVVHQNVLAELRLRGVATETVETA
ncbi:MAG: bifunctional uridylate/adenylate kinase [Lichina confinis]|nr:MAG: bifunctional uridylate/adenylate kinase [Lichina confinis]